ncbi:nuclear transport factor 2 family protein [Rhodococcus koreensis]
MTDLSIKQAVNDLVAKYADLCDQQDWNAVAALFTPDAVFDAETVYGKTMAGTEELLQFFTSAPVAAGHHPTSVYCTEITDSAVTARMKMLVIFRSGLFSVDYLWNLVPSGSDLRIARQTISLVGKVTLPKIEKAVASS